MCIGMKFKVNGAVDDNMCIGITAVGSSRSGRMMGISFAPCSGRCFVEHENKLTMMTQALPDAPEVREGHVWVHVTEKGGIRFIRQSMGCEIEDTGVLPHEMFPNWIQSYFADIEMWFSDLEAAVEVSVEHSSCEFPANM